MAKLYNLARMTTATTGTGTITLGSAASSYLSFASAGVQDGDVITYAIADGTDREIGRGTYTASGTTLSRDTILDSTNAGSAINLSGSAEVFITAAGEDFTLDSITGNGSTTSNSVTVGGATVSGSGPTLSLNDTVGSTTSTIYSNSEGDIYISADTTGAAANTTIHFLVDTFGRATITGNSASFFVSTTFTNGLSSDSISENTTGAGVTIDGVLLKDGTIDGVDMANVLVDSDIGSTVQAYDADTMKTDVAQTMTAQLTVKETAETNYNLTGLDVDPANGTIQYKTTTSALTGANAITGTNFANGQSVTLRLTAATGVEFSGFNWVTSDGNAPTIGSNNDVFVLWMDNSVKFVAYVGHD